MGFVCDLNSYKEKLAQMFAVLHRMSTSDSNLFVAFAWDHIYISFRAISVESFRSNNPNRINAGTSKKSHV